MKAAFVADVHLGNHKRFGGEVSASLNVRCRLSLAAFNAAIDLAIKERCATLTVAGDLFDYARPEPPLIAEVQRALAKGRGQMEMAILVGNHDQISTADGDHTLAPLAEFARIIEKPDWFDLSGSVDILTIPFRPGHAREWLPEAIRGIAGSREAGSRSRAAGGTRLLVLHLGIKDDRTAPWLVGAPDSIDVAILDELCEEYKIDFVFAGNWHDRRQWSLPKSGAFVLQLGALCPTGWDNPGIPNYGTVAIFDDEADVPVAIHEVTGPRFVSVRTKKEAENAIREATKKYALFLSFDADPDDVADLSSYVATNLATKGLFAAEVLPNREVALTKAKSAAFAAKSSKNTQEALSSFVRAMPLPETVSRNVVLQRSRGYLR